MKSIYLVRYYYCFNFLFLICTECTVFEYLYLKVGGSIRNQVAYQYSDTGIGTPSRILIASNSLSWLKRYYVPIFLQNSHSTTFTISRPPGLCYDNAKLPSRSCVLQCQYTYIWITLSISIRGIER